ncbi:DUF3641 domain-containing protein, partial [Vitellibacter sp. q18]|nr:DUF3641 domain-containing protein [Aequorivita lutea]
LLQNRKIIISQHCYGCTAGAGAGGRATKVADRGPDSAQFGGHAQCRRTADAQRRPKRHRSGRIGTGHGSPRRRNQQERRRIQQASPQEKHRRAH